jgi:hypothetical protein
VLLVKRPFKKHGEKNRKDPSGNNPTFKKAGLWKKTCKKAGQSIKRV